MTHRPLHIVRIVLSTAALGGAMGGVTMGVAVVDAAEAAAQLVVSAPEPPPIVAGRAARPGEYIAALNALEYDVELSLSRESPEIVGRTHVRILLGEPLPAEVALDFTGLAVDRVTLDGVGVGFLYREGKLRVRLPSDATTGDTLYLGIDYHGTPDDGLIMRRTRHGEPAVFADNWPNRARFWFPSIDHPSDKARATFTIHAPEDWQVVATGALMGQATPTVQGAIGEIEARRTWRYRTGTETATYTMVVGATEFVVERLGLSACGDAPASRRPDGCVEVSSWAYPPDAESALRLFAQAPDIVDFFARRVGPFPYAKLANVQSSTRFGGMENSSAIFYNETAPDRLDGTRLVAHEIAHQWFGDGVTAADWSHVWLSEGFATYFGALFLEHVEGAHRLHELMERSLQEVVSSPASTRPVVDPTQHNLFDALNSNPYQKGAWVLHMLRGLLGDEAFFAGIRLYYRSHYDGTAVTADLRRALESVSGEDLEWFFDQWLFEPGYPQLDVNWWVDGDELVLEVQQVQPPGWPAFRIPTEVEIRIGTGTSRRAILIDHRAQEIRVPVDGPPEAVRLDPDGWVLKRLRLQRR